MTGRFAQDRHRPDGKWVQATGVEEVVGIQFRRDDAQAFAFAARAAERKKIKYGLQLEHQPNNPHDRNAIAVFGVAEVKGFFRSAVKEWHIGYLPGELAAEICTEFVSKGVPIAAELYSIYEGKDGFLDFKVIVLAPPGNSLSSRERRARESKA